MKPYPRSPQLCWRLHKVHRAQRFEMTRRSGLSKSAVDLGPAKAASTGSRPREQVYRDLDRSHQWLNPDGVHDARWIKALWSAILIMPVTQRQCGRDARR